MIKSDNFYTLVGDTLADNWKNTSNDEEVDVFWDDDRDRFRVSSESKGVVYYKYEDFFFHHTWVDNKKLWRTLKEEQGFPIGKVKRRRAIDPLLIKDCTSRLDLDFVRQLNFPRLFRHV